MVLKPLHLMSEPSSSDIGLTVTVSEASQPHHAFGEHKRQECGLTGRPRTIQYKPAVLTNWMTPLLWSMISRAAIVTGPKMSPTDIVRQL